MQVEDPRGTPRRRIILVDASKPHTTVAATTTHATMPPARVSHHHTRLSIAAITRSPSDS